MNAEYITGRRFRNMMEELRQKLGWNEPGEEETGPGQEPERTTKAYGILASVGQYPGEEGPGSLPAWEEDGKLMAETLCRGFCVPEENLRILGENGCVTAADAAIALKEFARMLGSSDTLFFYFSGHGSSGSLIFSDGAVGLQGLLEVIEALPCQRKIVILDCCFAGDFHTAGPGIMEFAQSIAAYTGHGTAVFASCGADAISRSGPGGQGSLYTGMFAAAACSARSLYQGQRSLERISREVGILMEAWNRQHPDRAQHPVYRSSAAGDLLFPVEAYRPYVPQQVQLETERYALHGVRSLDNGQQRRLAAFVRLKYGTESDWDAAALADITREIAEKLRHAGVYRSEKDERKNRGRQAQVIWCYFGMDELDMLRSIYLAHTIWAADEELQNRYFRLGKYTEISGGICICRNPSYAIIRSMQKNMGEEAYRKETGRLLAELVTATEQLIRELRELDNGTLTAGELQLRAQEAARTVQNRFLELSDLPAAPEQLHVWAEEVFALAGWASDIATLLDKVPDERALWLIHHAADAYQAALEKVKASESSATFI